MKRTSALVLTLAAIGIMAGCATLEPRAREDALSPGYAILYELLSKESRSDWLSLIKKESPELKSLLEKIADTSTATVKELDALAGLDPPLNLKVTHLPRIERAARDSLDKETSQDILHSSGVGLEFNMASSQLAAMSYATHLARSLALVESNPRRIEFLQRTDRKFTELHRQVYKMLFTRYQRSG
jgi:hypothetical protein